MEQLLRAFLSTSACTIALGISCAAAQPATETPATSAGGASPIPRTLVRVPPDYPREAAARGLTGFVTLQFTVLANGSVADIIVVSSEPDGVFDQAAIEAVAQWRYAPQAATVPGVETRVAFSLNNGRPPSSPPSSTLSGSVTSAFRISQQLFSRQFELCDETTPRRDQPSAVRDLCEYIEIVMPTTETASQLPASPMPATDGFAIWNVIVVPLALIPANDPMRRVAIAQLQLSEAEAETLTSKAQAAVAEEQIHWSMLEREMLCGQPASFESGEDFYHAVDSIHRSRVPGQERIVADLLMTLDPALAGRLTEQGRQRGGVMLQLDFRQQLRDWSSRRLETAEEALCG